MSIPTPPPRRWKPHRWIRVIIAVVIICAVNAGLYAGWQKYAPWVTLFPTAQSETVSPVSVAESVTPVVMSEPLSAQDLTNSLLNDFPSIGTAWAKGKTVQTPMGLATDVVCPASNVTVPAVQGQRTWHGTGASIPTTAPTPTAVPSATASSQKPDVSGNGIPDIPLNIFDNSTPDPSPSSTPTPVASPSSPPSPTPPPSDSPTPAPSVSPPAPAVDPSASVTSSAQGNVPEPSSPAASPAAAAFIPAFMPKTANSNPDPTPSPTDTPSPTPSPSFTNQSPTPNLSSTDKSGLNSMVAQVRVYKAGLGAVTMDQIRTQIKTCVENDPMWNITWGGDLPIGKEGFYFIVRGDNAYQNVVVFREGDVIGVVAARGPADPASLASEWDKAWGQPLRDSCLNPNSTMTDAERQPLYKKYKGFVDTQPFSLTADEKTTIDNQVFNDLRASAPASASPDASGVLPVVPEETARMLELGPRAQTGPELEVYNEPAVATTSIKLDAKPDKPVYPKPIGEAPINGRVSGPAEDTKGPGCGWELTGQQIPPFDKEGAAQIWADSQSAETDRLSKKYYSWVMKTWKYSAAYDKYVNSVTEWNSWVVQSEMLIADAEWAAYDKEMTIYTAAQEQYQKDLINWRNCIASIPPEQPTPTPVPSGVANPIPSDSTVPVTPPAGGVTVCPPRPTPPPAAPDQPAMPRPVTSSTTMQ